ncbi:MAG: hypothetical protein L6R40_008188 [Gallowayella cf. fulva]|nr:MAG: hypothetical protein L6R40_008188 [Xanthomendoza cf. fulva]
MGRDRSRVRVAIIQDLLQQGPMLEEIYQSLKQHRNATVVAVKWNAEITRWWCALLDYHANKCYTRKSWDILKWADLLLVSCMQADTLAKMLHGIADNPLLETLRSWDVSKKIAIIPAMSRQMWENPMTRKQLSKIRRKWNWIRVLEPLTWDPTDAPVDAYKRWTGMQECVDTFKNQIDLLLLGHDHVPAGAIHSHNLLTSPTHQVQLPSEIWSIILQYTQDWELAKALDIYTDLPVPLEWRKDHLDMGYVFMQDLEWIILTGSLHDVRQLFHTHGSPRSLSSLCVKLIIRFSRTDILSYLEADHKDLFWSQFGHTLLPTKASAYFGQTAILDWWQRSPSFLTKEYNADALDFASKSGFVNVLQWWRTSGLPLRYTDAALEQASSQGHIAVLEWWRSASHSHQDRSDSIAQTQHTSISAARVTDKTSSNGDAMGLHPLRLKVGKSLIYAAQNGQTATIHWWMTSGIPTVHEEAVARTASANGHVNVLRLWKEIKGEKMQYDNQVLVGPTKNEHVDVLEWWKASGYRVEYKTCDIEEALEDSRGGEGEETIRRWWAKNGLNLGVGTSEWMKLKIL